MSWLVNAVAGVIKSVATACPADPTKPMSVAFWFYPTFDPATDTTNRILVAYKTTGAVYTDYFRVIKDSSKKWRAGFKQANVDYENTSSSVVSFTQNAWHHVVTTWGPGTAVKLYVDGALITMATSTHPSAALATSPLWTWGSWHDASPGTQSNCYIAEWSVFNQTLTAAQVTSLYQGRTPYSVGSVLSYVPFRDNTFADLQTGAAGSVGTAGAITISTSGGSPSASIIHPTVDDPWPAVVKPTARPGRSRFIERLVEWTKQETSPYVYVLDRVAGTTTVGNETGTTPLVVSGATLGTAGILPGDSRTCASFDGTDDYASIAHESGISFERTDTFAINATIHLDQNLADGEYEIVSKTSALAAYLGYRLYVTLASGSASLGAALSDGTRTIVADTAAGTIPLGVPVNVALLYDGSSANTAIQLYIQGDKKAVTASGTTLSSTIINTADLFVGKKVLNVTSSYFKGRIASVAIYKPSVSTNALKVKHFTRIKSLGTLALNDVPDLYIKDSQGNIHRPGDPGYKPNVIYDVDADDDYGDPFGMDILANYVDAGLVNLKALLVTPRKGHTTAAAIPAAIKTTRRLSCRIGTYQGNDIGTTTSSTFAAAIAADSTLIGSGASANSSYSTNVDVFKASATDLPDKSVVFLMGGHCKGMEAIRADSAAWTLFQSKVAFVVAMFGAYQPNPAAITTGSIAAGTVFHSNDFDGSGTDVEYNVGVNGGVTAADTDAASFSAFFTALNTAGIPLVVMGWNFAVRSAINAPAHGRAFSLLTSGNVSKTAETASGTTAGTGRSPWEPYCPWVAAHGLLRSVNAGGPEWIGRGTIAFNTAVNTPYDGTSEGSWSPGYTRFLPTVGSGNAWVLFFDDGTTGDRVGQLLCDHIDRFIGMSGATGTGNVGDRPTLRTKQYVLD